MGVINLGQVQAIWIGTTPPTNTNMIWWDLNVTLHKYYKTATSTWETFVLNGATAPLSRSGDSIILVFNTDQFEIVAGALKIKDDVLLSVLPTIAISDITGLTDALDNKVTVVTGKSLILDTEIARLSTVIQYTHPTNHPPSIISQDASNRFVTDTEKDTWNNKQDALGFEPYAASNPDEYLTAADVAAINTSGFSLKLKNGSDLLDSCAARLVGLVEGTDFPTGWVLSAQSGFPKNLLVVHNLGKRSHSITISTTEGANQRVLFGNAAYAGIMFPDNNSFVIENIATISLSITATILMI